MLGEDREYVRTCNIRSTAELSPSFPQIASVSNEPRCFFHTKRRNNWPSMFNVVFHSYCSLYFG